MQVIRRFTGGGTVVVDQDTIFSTLIFQGAALPHVECYPQPIMAWTESFYSHAFSAVPGFRQRENDYVFGERKFGGNAQAITGKRWLHHSSLLWDFQPQRMGLLAHPRKQPQYRQGRHHSKFLVPLSQEPALGSRDQLVDRLQEAAYMLPGFTIQEVSMQQASEALIGNKMCGTRLVDLSAALSAPQL